MQILDYFVTHLTSVMSHMDFQVRRQPRRGEIFEKIIWLFPNPNFRIRIQISGRIETGSK